MKNEGRWTGLVKINGLTAVALTILLLVVFGCKTQTSPSNGDSRSSSSVPAAKADDSFLERYKEIEEGSTNLAANEYGRYAASSQDLKSFVERYHEIEGKSTNLAANEYGRYAACSHRLRNRNSQ